MCLGTKDPLTGKVNDALLMPAGVVIGPDWFRLVGEDAPFWNFAYAQDGVTSTVRLARPTYEKSVYCVDDIGWEKLRDYLAWLEALSNGLAPVGRVGLCTQVFPNAEELYDHYFDIELLSAERLNLVKNQCEKALCAYELAKNARADVTLNEELFSTQLSLDSLREAVEVISNQPSYPPELNLGDSGLALVYKKGQFAVRAVGASGPRVAAMELSK